VRGGVSRGGRGNPHCRAAARKEKKTKKKRFNRQPPRRGTEGVFKKNSTKDGGKLRWRVSGIPCEHVMSGGRERKKKRPGKLQAVNEAQRSVNG